MLMPERVPTRASPRWFVRVDCVDSAAHLLAWSRVQGHRRLPRRGVLTLGAVWACRAPEDTPEGTTGRAITPASGAGSRLPSRAVHSSSRQRDVGVAGVLPVVPSDVDPGIGMT
jgi:hypothetical protein